MIARLSVCLCLVVLGAYMFIQAQTDQGQVQTDQGQTGQAQTDQGQTGQAQTDQGQAGQAQTDQGQTGQAQPGQGTNDGLDGSRDMLVATINKFRTQDGLQPLKRWPEGDACANEQAKADFENFEKTKVPHYSAQNNKWCGGGAMAQNTFPNGWTIDMINTRGLQMWYDRPAEEIHHKNMMNPGHTLISIGFYQAPDGTYWTNMNFK